MVVPTLVPSPARLHAQPIECLLSADPECDAKLEPQKGSMFGALQLRLGLDPKATSTVAMDSAVPVAMSTARLSAFTADVSS
jgi:hypothetical protein